MFEFSHGFANLQICELLNLHLGPNLFSLSQLHALPDAQPKGS